LKKIAAAFEEKYKVPLRLIIVDTMITAFAIENWNDPAQVTAVTNKLHDIAKQTGAAVMGIAHHGKDISRGVTGSFAQKANVDFLLSIYIKRANDNDPLSDVISRHIHLSKYRDGPEGWQREFRLQSVPVGERRDGKTVFSAYVVPIDPDKASRLLVEKKKGKERPDGRALRAFKDAFNEAAVGFGENQRLHGDGPNVRCVPFEHVREAFRKRYIDGDSDEKKAVDAERKAFKRAREEAAKSWAVQEGKWADKQWLWRTPDKDIGQGGYVQGPGNDLVIMTGRPAGT
jgi:hypothetical protein